MGKKVTNGGNRRWATCYADLCALRVLQFPSLILWELLLPGGKAHETSEFLLPSHPSRNDKYLTVKVESFSKNRSKHKTKLKYLESKIFFQPHLIRVLILTPHPPHDHKLEPTKLFDGTVVFELLFLCISLHLHASYSLCCIEWPQVHQGTNIRSKFSSNISLISTIQEKKQKGPQHQTWQKDDNKKKVCLLSSFASNSCSS